MKNRILIIAVLLCFVGFSTACNDDSKNGDNPSEPTAIDLSLVGTK
jgi:hypothetical protein